VSSDWRLNWCRIRFLTWLIEETPQDNLIRPRRRAASLYNARGNDGRAVR